MLDTEPLFPSATQLAQCTTKLSVYAAGNQVHLEQIQAIFDRSLATVERSRRLLDGLTSKSQQKWHFNEVGSKACLLNISQPMPASMSR